MLICRKDSLGYVDFLRGKYPLNNKQYIEHIFSEMTNSEKERILNSTFDELWHNLWGENIGIQYRGEERVSREKLKELTSGLVINDETFNLKDIIEDSDKKWSEPEWGFPKGRRNFNENDLQCALREFSEETGYPKSQVSILKNVIPFDEIFTGSNFKSYKHRYFLAHSTYSNTQIYQKSEVSKLKWVTLNEALTFIRPYNLEKIDVIKQIDNLLNEFRLIS